MSCAPNAFACEECWEALWKESSVREPTKPAPTFPECSHDGCTIDAFGVNHGHNCQRAKFILELQEAWPQC